MRRIESVEEMLAAVDAAGLAPGSWVATDADGTLWAADVADLAWRRALGERRLRVAAAEAMARELGQLGERSAGEVHADAARLYELYGLGRADDWAMLRAMTSCWAGWSEEELRAFGRRLWAEQLSPRVYHTTCDLLQGLCARGYRLAVVSGSPQLLVEEAVGALGITTRPVVVGALQEQEGALLSERLHHPLPWEQGKVELLRARIEGQSVPRAIAAAFGDTFGDLALLNAADGVRVLVHPRPSLLRHAQQSADAAWIQFSPRWLRSGEAVVPPGSDQVLQPG